MSRNVVTVILLAVSIVFACSVSNSRSPQGKTNQPAESKEPPLKYTLKIGDKTIAVNEGETFSYRAITESNASENSLCSFWPSW